MHQIGQSVRMRALGDGRDSGRETSERMCPRTATSHPPWESDQREVLRATFDQDAEAYDRSRPVAPGDVFDEVMQLASLSAGIDWSSRSDPAPAKRHDNLQHADCRSSRWSWVRISPERARAEPCGVPAGRAS